MPKALLLNKVLNLLKAGIETKEQIDTVFKLLDSAEFPIEDLIKQIDVSQNAWLSKIAKQFDLNSEGICAVLNHMRGHNDYKTHYTFLAKLALCPEKLVASLLELPQFEKKWGSKQTQFEIFAKVIESPEAANPEIIHGSTGEIDKFLTNQFKRQSLEVYSSNNLINYLEKKHFVDKCSDFFDWQVFNKEVLKKLEVGDDVSLSAILHRFSLMVKPHPTDATKKQFILYDSNAKHGDVICHSEEEAIAAIKGVLKKIYLLIDEPYLKIDAGALRVRVYSNVTENQKLRFNKSAIVEAAVKKGIDAREANGMGNIWRSLTESNKQIDIALQTLETQKTQLSKENTQGLAEIEENIKTFSTTKNKNNEIINNIIKITHDFTPLYLAVRNGDIETVKLLLENGADTNIPVTYTIFEDNPTTKERKPRQFFISPLTEAAKHGYTDIVEMLLNHGAPTVIKNGANPLIEAARNDRREVVRCLLAKRGDELDKHLITAINTANQHKATETHQFLTALQQAKQNNNYEMVKQLLTPNITLSESKDEKPALHESPKVAKRQRETRDNQQQENIKLSNKRNFGFFSDSQSNVREKEIVSPTIEEIEQAFHSLSFSCSRSLSFADQCEKNSLLHTVISLKRMRHG